MRTTGSGRTSGLAQDKATSRSVWNLGGNNDEAILRIALFFYFCTNTETILIQHCA